MSTLNSTDRIATWLVRTSALVLCLLPFHALLTTWAGASLGHIDVWRIWKELIIFVIMPVVVWLALRTPPVRTWLRYSPLAKLLLAYMLWQLGVGIFGLHRGYVNGEALIYGLLVNLRFLGFFGVCLCLSVRTPWLSKQWWRLLLIPGVIVVSFGLLQLILPLNFLTHFGYGPNTIPAFQTIDQKLDYQRIQSTLRGANPLGAYLLLVICGLIVYKSKNSWLRSSVLVASFAALFFTYSRSAWLGTLVAIALLVRWLYPTVLTRKRLLLTGLLGIVIMGLGLGILRKNDRFENTIFHTNEKSVSSESSNEGRTQALHQGVRDAIHEPLGRGPGTAGPASTRNTKPARIAENYYLQLAQETGWLGLGLFLSIQICIALQLWRFRSDRQAQVLLASLAGLTLVNFVSHAWADDTLGLLWWGLAGITYGGVILNEKRKHNGTKEIATKT